MSRGCTPAGLMQFGKHVYTDPLDEAKRCRTECALFDFSFVKRAALRGVHAMDILHRFQSRDLHSMPVGRIYYALRGDDITPGFTVRSDLTIWKIAEHSYEIFSGRPQDILDLEYMSVQKAEFEDLSATTRIYSVQGPASLAALKRLGISSTPTQLPYFGFQPNSLEQVNFLIGRLGYTGEAGFEIVVEGEQSANALWSSLTEVVSPAGMIAADILRIEAGFILFLNECRLQATATELDIANYATKSASDAKIRLICFQCECDFEKLPFSAANELVAPKQGEIAITSVNRSQFSDNALGLGFVNVADLSKAQFHDPVGWFHQIKATSRPFYDVQKERPRLPWQQGVD